MRTFGVFTLVMSMATVGCSQSTVARRTPAPVEPLGAPAAPGTSREVLERTRMEMEARLQAQPADAAAAVRLAAALQLWQPAVERFDEPIQVGEDAVGRGGFLVHSDGRDLS